MKSLSKNHLLPLLLFALIGTALLSFSSAAPSTPNDPNFPLADTNGDLTVDIFDLSYVLGRWNSSEVSADFNTDGIVNIQDLSYLLAQWGRVDSNESGDLGWNFINGVPKPGVHNTGPTDVGALQTVDGNIRIDTPGTVVENVDLTSGKIDIRASNVTVRNFRIDAGMTFYGIHVRGGLTNVVIEDGEVTNTDSAGVRCESACTIRRLHIHDHDSDGMKIDGQNGQSIIENNYITRLGTGEGSHADGNQSVRGQNLTFRYNNFYMPYPGTAAHDAQPLPPGVTRFRSNATFIIHDETDNLLIEHNWLTGGNWTIYGSDGTVVRNNVIGRDNRSSPDALDEFGAHTCSGASCDGTKNVCNGPFDDWSGNVMEDGVPFGDNATCE